MFTKGSFFNAGYTIKQISDFLPFLRATPRDKRPRYLIIPLDQWMFNKNSQRIKEKDPRRSETRFRGRPAPTVYRRAWTRFLKGDLSRILEQRSLAPIKFGLDAHINGAGLRNDGSMNCGIQIKRLLEDDPETFDRGFEATLRRIRKGGHRFQAGATVNQKALLKLEQLLTYCDEEGIAVIGFLPPFADPANKALRESGRHEYLSAIPLSCSELFQNFHEHEFWNFSELQTFDSLDDEMIDGFHAGEVGQAKMVLNMLERGSILGKVAEKQTLREDLARRSNSLQLYTHPLDTE